MSSLALVKTIQKRFERQYEQRVEGDGETAADARPPVHDKPCYQAWNNQPSNRDRHKVGCHHNMSEINKSGDLVAATLPGEKTSITYFKTNSKIPAGTLLHSSRDSPHSSAAARSSVTSHVQQLIQPQSTYLISRSSDTLPDPIATQQAFADGEPLIPPPPLGADGEDGIDNKVALRPDQEYPPMEQHGLSSLTQPDLAVGYVPSKPKEKCQGDGSEILLSKHSHQSESPVGRHAYQNKIFLEDAAVVRGVAHNQAGTALRAAWTRMYGGVADTIRLPGQLKQSIQAPNQNGLSAAYTQESPMGQSTDITSQALLMSNSGTWKQLAPRSCDTTQPRSPRSVQTTGSSAKVSLSSNSYLANDSANTEKSYSYTKRLSVKPDTAFQGRTMQKLSIPTRKMPFSSCFPVLQPAEQQTISAYQGSLLNESDQSLLDVNDSIFDYSATGSVSSLSVSPPLPPDGSMLNVESRTAVDTSRHSCSYSTNLLLEAKVPEAQQCLVRPQSANPWQNEQHNKHVNFKIPNKRNARTVPCRKSPNSQIALGHMNRIPGNRGKESDDGNLSFDIDDTILTVDSHDSDMEPAARNPLTSNDISGSQLSEKVMTCREDSHFQQQLDTLQMRYDEILKLVTASPGQRWSIGSSDTSSLKREPRFKRRQMPQKNITQDAKIIKNRFQRLESHVVTLARSIAHISSEMHSYNRAFKELENLKQEIQKLRTFTAHIPSAVNSCSVTEFEKFRGWMPSLTNPKRINKLTKFFGQEPPLLEFFLKKLGYERYAPNFEAERIGMIELPYMTEDRLQKIGIPMGPRIRILQESQLCFRQENFNIYIV